MRQVALGLALFALAPTTAGAQTFSNPVGCDGCIANWYYFDGTGEGGGVEDWSCASSSYEYHRGSDFSLAGGNAVITRGWDVVAAADGTVVSTQDGHYDHCNTCSSSVDARCGTGFGFGYGNQVVINHGSYRVIYAHMRTGSVRVGPGDAVRCGDVIGQIASSGCSTGAHLHFETRPLGGAFTTAFDPFAGGCSATSPTRWTTQGTHRGMPGRGCGAPTPTCPAGTFSIWTCDAARTERRRCIDGVDETEPCAHGCVSMPVGTDDECAPPPDADGDGSPADEDCDDDDPTRHPGAMERCGDGVDQDCDGEDLACPGVDAGVPAPIDAATPPRDASSAIDAAAADASDTSRPTSIVGGCGCRAATSGRGGGALGLLFLAALTVTRRRRLLPRHGAGTGARARG